MAKLKPKTQKPKIIFLVGPTAVGKTALSLKLAWKINAQIISLDSMQVYQGIDILSSKPGLKPRQEIKHHLIDILSPDKEFDAACYRRLAVRAIKDIHQKGKIPLFVGGTGLYLKVLLRESLPEQARMRTCAKNFTERRKLREAGISIKN